MLSEIEEALVHLQVTFRCKEYGKCRAGSMRCLLCIAKKLSDSWNDLGEDIDFVDTDVLNGIEEEAVFKRARRVLDGEIEWVANGWNWEIKEDAE